SANSTHSSSSLSFASTEKSSSVVVSPLTSPLVASSLNRRRIILPDLVLGSVSENRMSSGRASAPISFATHWRNSSLSAGLGVDPDPTVTNAAIACPSPSSGLATTAASATFGWPTSADSTSIVLSRWPETLITSSTRPNTQKYPSSSRRAPSPVKYMPGISDQYCLTYLSGSLYIVLNIAGHGFLITR